MAFYKIIKAKIPAGVATFHGSRILNEQNYKKCYKLLEIPENSNKEEIKKAYLSMVKRYHPDSCTAEANADKFHQIDEAFRALMTRKSQENIDIEEEEDPEVQDIRHTAPQHRQYLSYEGMGYGTPFQREKQYKRFRAVQASDSVMQHRLSKAAADDKSLMVKGPHKHKITTKCGLDRLVEDLIQEAMSKGKFDNLSGCGKPLPDGQNRNPYVDFVTHKLNEILIENGFTPEWIMLQKEIQVDIQVFRDTLHLERIKFPPYPLTVEENIGWSNIVYQYKDMVDKLNKKINKYNLLVPILQRQMLYVSIQKEAQRVLLKGKSNKEVINANTNATVVTVEDQPLNLFSFLTVFFKKIK